MRYMARPLSFRWDEEFVARIDDARRSSIGVVSRSAFVRDAIEFAIRREEHARRLAGEYVAVEQTPSEAKEPSANEQADPGSVSSPEDVRSAAPAEQPEPSVEYRTFSPLGPPGRARRSDEAKRGIQPIVKGGKS